MLTFEWTSPIRRDGVRSLDPIPLEIYQEIFNHLHESDEMTNTQVRRTLSNLALVCRFFSSVALPRIFATMEFSGGVGVSGDQTPSTSRFCRALIKDQEPAKTLAQYVKTCRFTSWNGLDMSDTVIHSRDAFFSMYCNALRKMVSVDSVDLHLVLVDKRILRAIKKLQHLRSLRFSQCRFSKSLDLNELQAVARSLDLESFVIFDCRKGHIFHSAFTSALKFDYLRSLEVDEWTIIQRLADYEGHLPIQSLTIHHTRDALLLPDLFLRTPELSQLHIYRMDLINDIESVHFPGSTLPKLSFYDGPPALATVLVPSRPLSKIWLLGTLVELPTQAFLPPLLPPLEQRTWDALKQSTASVREIAIPRHLYSIGFLKSYLPNVSVLKLSWYHGNWIDDIVESSDEIISAIRRLCNLWSQNPSVRKLVFDLHPHADEESIFYNLPSQHDILSTQIVDAFPNIEQVNFTSPVNWRRSVSSKTWRAEIPKAKRRYFYSTWIHHRNELIDYGSCFEAVFNITNCE